MMAQKRKKTPQKRNKTTRTETEDHLHTEEFQVRKTATKGKEDSVSVMSHFAPCIKHTVRLPLHLMDRVLFIMLTYASLCHFAFRDHEILPNMQECGDAEMLHLHKWHTV